METENKVIIGKTQPVCKEYQKREFKPDLFFFGAKQILKNPLVVDDFRKLKSCVGIGPGIVFKASFNSDELALLSLKVKPFFNQKDSQTRLCSCREFVEMRVNEEKYSSFASEYKLIVDSVATFNKEKSILFEPEKFNTSVKLGQGIPKISLFGDILNGMIFHFDEIKVNKNINQFENIGIDGFYFKMQEYCTTLKHFCQLIIMHNNLLFNVTETNERETDLAKALDLIHNF